MSSVCTRQEIKEEAGKVFTVELIADSECRVLRLKVSGDFFAYPPEILDSLESDATGRHVLDLVDLVLRVLGRLVLVGVRKESVVSLFERASAEVLTKCGRG